MAVTDELSSILGNEMGQNTMSVLAGIQKGVGNITVAFANLTKGVAKGTAEFQKMAHTFMTQTLGFVAPFESSFDGFFTKVDQAFSALPLTAGKGAKAIEGLAEASSASAVEAKNATEATRKFGDCAKGAGEKGEESTQKWLVRIKAVTSAYSVLSTSALDLVSRMRSFIKGVEIPDSVLSRSKEFQTNIQEIRGQFGAWNEELFLGLMPTLTSLTKGVNGFLQENRRWISSGIETVTSGVGSGFDRFGESLENIKPLFDPLIDKIKPFISEMDELDTIGHLVHGALGGLSLLLTPIAIKFGLIAFAIALAALAVDDFLTYLNGGDSLIGRFFDAFESRWPELSVSIREAGTLLKSKFFDLLESGKNIAQSFGSAASKSITDLLDGINGMVGPVKDFFNTFDEKFPNLSKLLENVSNIFSGTFKVALEGAVSILGELGNAISAVLNSIGELAVKLAGITDTALGKGGELVKATAKLAKKFIPDFGEGKGTGNDMNDVLGVGDLNHLGTRKAFLDDKVDSGSKKSSSSAKTSPLHSVSQQASHANTQYSEPFVDSKSMTFSTKPLKHSRAPVAQYTGGGVQGGRGPALDEMSQGTAAIGKQWFNYPVVGSTTTVTNNGQDMSSKTFQDNRSASITVYTQDGQAAGEAAHGALLGQPANFPGATPQTA